MSKTNYYIGIGGTGARLGEALIHLCAAGLGPEHLTLFLIDPDKGNGNLARTKRLADAYSEARANFRDRAGDDVLVFKTDLRVPKPMVWEIFPKSLNLRDHIDLNSLSGWNKELAVFASVLFSHEELTTKLDEGFRGHPNIGSLVISDIPDMDKGDPWKTFWADVRQAGQVGEVQVFLVGSVFGGTGAAGIPTLGAPNTLKFHDDAKHGSNSSKIRLGAGLILPYFTFDPGKPPDGKPQMHVTPADFSIATKGALDFYFEKAGRDLAFDDVYLLGDSLRHNVGEFAEGTSRQENDPHYIELVGALAALDFYESTSTEDNLRYFQAGRANGKPLGWNDLPVSRDPNTVSAKLGLLKQRLVTMTTFASAFLSYGVPVLGQDREDVDDPWHADHFYPRTWYGKRDKEKDPRKQEDKERLAKVEAYLQRYLGWAAALDHSSGDVHLFDKAKLQTVAGEVPRYDQHPHAIGTFLRDSSQNQDFTDFKDILNATDVRNQPNASVANSDVFVNLFYRAARDFATQNYLLQQDTVAQTTTS